MSNAKRLGRLVLELDADNKKLRSELQDTNQRIGKMSRQMHKHNKMTQDSFAAVGRAAKALGAAIAGAFAISAIKGTLEYTQELQKMADMATVNVEAFQELASVAAEFGVDADRVADALKELNLRAAEFADRGTGGAADAFREMGFDRAEINALTEDTDKFFMTVLSRLDQLPESRRGILLDEIFGGTGGELLQGMVARGVEGIRELRDEARATGQVMSEGLVIKSVEANREIEKLSRILKTQFASAIAINSDKIMELISALSRALPGIVSALASVADMFNTGMTDNEFLAANRTFLAQSSDALGLVQDAAKRLTGRSNLSDAEISNLRFVAREGLTPEADILDQAFTVLDKLEKRYKAFLEAHQEQADRLLGGDGRPLKVNVPVTANQPSQGGGGSPRQPINIEAQRQAEGLFFNSLSDDEKRLRLLEKMKPVQQELVKLTGDQAEASRIINEAIEKQIAGTDKAGSLQGDLLQIQAQFWQGFASAIAASIVNASSLGDAFRGILSQMIQLVIQAMILRAVLGPLGLLPGFANGGSVGMMPALATGGAVDVSRGGMLRGPGGPRGDKILSSGSGGPFMGSDSEYVINAAAARAIGIPALNYMNATGALPAFAAGGSLSGIGAATSMGGINITQEISLTDVAPTVRAQIEQSAPRIAEAAANAVEMRRRGIRR